MRYRVMFVACLGWATASQAQLLAPAKPLGASTPAAQQGPASQPASPQQPALQPTAVAKNAPQSQPAPAAGVLTLSDLAKKQSAQPQSQTAQPPAPTSQVEVPAITLVDGAGKPIDAARDRMASAGVPQSERRTNISLVRISRSGMESTALLWVKGQNRKVTTGSRVLNYTVGELKEDGVCLYPSKGRSRNKCTTMISFMKGVD